MDPVSLFAELNRRRVFRAIVGYGIAAFAVLQIIEPVMHGLHWPEAVLSYVVVALALGFPLMVALAWVFDVKAGRIERTAPAAGGTSMLIHNRALLALVLAGVGVLAAAPGVVYFFFLRSGARATAVSQSVAVGATPALPAMASIAVLPFVDMSAQKDQEYFSDGVAEEILNALSQVDGLRVIGRSSSFSFKGRNEDLRGIGEKLGVAHLLEGSVRKSGSRIRVTAQLIETSGGSHLWSKVYDSKLTDIFAVQDEIARGVVAALKVKLLPPARAAHRTASLEAHDLYLKGRYFWNKRTGEALRRSAEFFEDSIRHDRSYALAYCGLADALAMRIEYDNARPSEMLPKAKEAALRALELEPGLAEAHAALGNIANYQNGWTAALAEHRKALDLNPNYAMAQKWIGNILMITGHLQEARVAFERAVQMDPASLIARTNVGETYFFERDFQTAIEQFRLTLEMDPEFEQARLSLARAYSWQGKHAEALAETDRLHITPITNRQLLRANVLARAGRREEALALARGLEARSGREHLDAGAFAAVWLALGDNDKALTLLGKACADHEPMDVVEILPEMDPVRADPRFHEVLRCANLE